MSDVVDSILRLVRAESIDVDALESTLDESTHEERLEAVRLFGSSIQSRLYRGVEGCEFSIDALVPPETPSMTEVVHEGQNTLPVFSTFQKRFCRPDMEHLSDEERDVLWGYNEQTLKWFTGPGYFVAYDDATTGEVCIDYRETPEAIPDDWPAVSPNDRGLSRFVYAGTVDRLRRVSRHVSIGRAYRDDEEALENWFTLLRRPSEEMDETS